MNYTKTEFSQKFLKTKSCWLWKSPSRADGYCPFDGSYAHIASFLLYKGKIPKGCEIHHKCGTRNCVNPEHLDAVDASEHRSMHRMVICGSSKTHCPKGHEFSPLNTYIDCHGYRQCRECHRLHERRWKRRDRGKNAKAGAKLDQ